MMTKRTLEERIASLSQPTGSGCTEWTGYKNWLGYGKISVDGKPINAHRAAYVAFVGAIPDGMHVCHKCDNRACVNPEHLFLGTASDNMLDMYQKNRHQRGSGLKGSAHPAAKISEVDVLAIRAASGRPVEIAAKFGITRAKAYQILNRITWKHI